MNYILLIIILIGIYFIFLRREKFEGTPEETVEVGGEVEMGVNESIANVIYTYMMSESEPDFTEYINILDEIGNPNTVVESEDFFQSLKYMKDNEQLSLEYILNMMQ